MFPIIDKFIPESLAFLSSLKTPEEIAEGCITLLKGNGINKLSAHEFTHWLDQSKNYLETALKVEQKSKDVRDLLTAELNVRKHHVQIPIYLQYGKVEGGKVIEPPQMKLLSWERISQAIIPTRGKENWNEEAAIADILDRKENFDINFDGSYVNPYMLVKRFFNAQAPQEYYVVQTQQDADALTSYLANLKVFLWKEYMNCEYRSQAACEYLEGFNVDPRQLYYVRIGKRFMSDSSIPLKTPDGRIWSYHQAIAIKMPSGELLVLDPASDSEKALTMDEWSSMYENSKVYRWPALECPKDEEPDLKKWHSEWNTGKYTHSQQEQKVETAFAVARGEKLPQLKEIISGSHPHLKAITQLYEAF